MEIEIKKVDGIKLAIIYRDSVNVRLFGLQNLHPFDSCKYEKIRDGIQTLVGNCFVDDCGTDDISERGEHLLQLLHDSEYIERSKTRDGLAAICETRAIKYKVLDWWNCGIINSWLDTQIVSRLRTPMLVHVYNTVEATLMALKCGRAITLSGGMHHASRSRGHGWCAFGDIQIALNYLRKFQNKKRAIIIDLDVHQGDGYQRDKEEGHIGDPNDVYVLDFYKYRMDISVDSINRAVKVDASWDDIQYLDCLKRELNQTERESKPSDIIFYNAGTDTLEGDPLGKMSLSPECIIKRDEIVFEWAIRKMNVPIVMLLSGGYAKNGHDVIAQSISNLFNVYGK